MISAKELMFPLVLLQVKAVGFPCFEARRNRNCVSISSPSGEGGGTLRWDKVPTLVFPLVLLQVKAVGSIQMRMV